MIPAPPAAARPCAGSRLAHADAAGGVDGRPVDLADADEVFGEIGGMPSRASARVRVGTPTPITVAISAIAASSGTGARCRSHRDQFAFALVAK